jgi:hypothetical protein
VKRAIIGILGLVALALIIRDVSQATEDVQTIRSTDAAVALYVSRHGDMTRDERFGYLDNAYQACSYLDKNPSISDLWLAMTDSRISGDAAATTIEAAVTYLCTEHKGLLA